MENLPQEINEDKKGMMLQGYDTTRNLELSLETAERFFTLQDRIKKSAIKVTNQNDWIDQNGNPYLQWKGASSIACAFGVSYSDLNFSKENDKDDDGEFVIYTATAMVKWQGRSVPEIGTGSSRDSFFGKRGGRFLPLSEVDLNNVKKKALTNMLNRGIKSLLGLSFTWNDIEKYSDGKITRNGVSKVSYDKGKKGGKIQETPEIIEKRSEIRSMLSEMYMDDLQKGCDYLFEITNNEEKGFKGKSKVDDLTSGQIPYIHKRVEAKYNKMKREAIDSFNKKQVEENNDANS